MQIRVVQLKSRHPLVGALLLVVVMALVAVLLTAGMALVAGGALVGGVAYALRRIVGGTSLRGAGGGRAHTGDVTMGRLGTEVFPPSGDAAGLPSAEVTGIVTEQAPRGGTGA